MQNEVKKVELDERWESEKAILYRIPENGGFRYLIRTESRRTGKVDVYTRVQLRSGGYLFATPNGREYNICADDTALCVFFDNDLN